MNKLKHPIFKPLLPVRAGEIYNGNILRFSFVNDNEREGSVFGCCGALITILFHKNIIFVKKEK
jgi:hypothetical protein